ncbi:hypothetical protein ACQKJC_15070 [Priestia koreensis]|uniref:hypothetical protein n=1 Tax=Priestia koreensis TaxID=284581 RepID=UPI003D08031E
MNRKMRHSCRISESGEIPQDAKRRGSSPLAPWKAKQPVAKIRTHRSTEHSYKKRRKRETFVKKQPFLTPGIGAKDAETPTGLASQVRSRRARSDEEAHRSPRGKRSNL